MKTMVERLREQMQRSDEFSRDNFGLVVGDSYPELCRELTGNEPIAGTIVIEQLRVLMSDAKRFQEAASRGDILGVAREAAVARALLKWLYWGMEIGRELERESRTAEAVSAEGKA